MPKPYPKEFRDDVVWVARNRDDGVTLEQVAADFGVHPMTLSKWMRKSDIDDGNKPGTTRLPYQFHAVHVTIPGGRTVLGVQAVWGRKDTVSVPGWPVAAAPVVG
ncbi:hypothetical protein ABZ412_15110 [Nocardia sp. NPDC005746]|uniref:hypothetical protein n=1 Tax=Nocardia sp. NPDC005746 TaxID=3157062 RepID=UPI0033F16E9A